MAFAPRSAPRYRQEEIVVTPKQREVMAKRKGELIGQMNEKLDQMPDSPMKQDLIKKRDHAIAKFPVFPDALSIWIIAYHEDWMREYDLAQSLDQA